MGYALIITGGEKDGERVIIPEDKPVLVGRGTQNDLCIPDKKLSRHHCQFLLSNGKCVVMDLGSTNGTFVDGVKIDSREVASGETVTLGRISLRIEYQEEAGPETEPSSADKCAECGREISEEDAASHETRLGDSRILCDVCWAKLAEDTEVEPKDAAHKSEPPPPSSGIIFQGVASAPETLSSPRRFGKYNIKKHLRDFFLGRQYLAEREEITIPMVLTVLADPAPDVGRKLLQSIEDSSVAIHPNILMLFEVGEEGGEFFYSCENISGRTLDSLMTSDGPVPPRLAFRITDLLAHAITAAAEKHINQGLLTPCSIYVDENHRCKLGEFGIGRIFGPDTIGGGFAPFMLPFIAPEQLNGKSGATFEGDCYSLGATLYYALSGKLPYEGSRPAEIAEMAYKCDRRPIEELCPGLSGRVYQFVDRCMAAIPTNRYQNGVEMIQEIERIIPLL